MPVLSVRRLLLQLLLEKSMKEQRTENTMRSETTGRKGLSAYHMALGGILLALCIAGVFMSSVVPGAEMTLLLVASAGIFIFCKEAGAAGGFVLYAAACLLSLVLVPNKLAVLPLALVFGLYPVVKYLLEKALQNKWLCLAAKTVYYVIAGVLAVNLAGGLMFSSAATSALPQLAEWPQAAMLAAGWVVFVAYDTILSFCGRYYEKRFAGRLSVTGKRPAGKAQETPPEFKLYHGDETEQDGPSGESAKENF